MRSRIAVALMAALVLGRSSTLWADPCGDDDINSVMHDPRVREAMDNAWRDSQEGTPDEHEEGGYVYHCRSANGDGSYRYYTLVVRWSSGGRDGIASNPPQVMENCYPVADFHTHPGPQQGVNPGRDEFTNELPSDADQLESANNGLPGIIRYGHGADPANTRDFAYGYNDMTEPRDRGFTCGVPPRAGWAVGEPHLNTLDNAGYDFHGIGDYVLARAVRGDVEIQVRQQPWATTKYAAVIAGLAVRDGRDRIEWALGQPDPKLNGVPRSLAVGASLKLASHGHLDHREEGYELTSSVGDHVLVTPNDGWLDVRVTMAPHRRGAMEGLLGNNDGEAGNDLHGPDGAAFDPPFPPPDYRHPVYAVFGRALRVTGTASLFAEPYRAPAGIDPQTFPAAWPATDEATTQTAVAACANVVDAGGLRANCIADVTVTGDTKFVAATTRVAKALEGVVMAAPPGGGAVPADTSLEGTLGAGRTSARFTVSLAAGTYVFDGRGSRGTSWLLTTSNGETPFDSNQGAFMGEYPARLAVTRAGAATVVVSLQPGESAGRFVFIVRTVPAHESRNLSVGASATATIDQVGEEIQYTLPLRRGTYDFLTQEARNTSWTLRTAAGDSLFDANQSAFMEDVRGLTIPADGVYQLIVQGRGVLGLGIARFRVTAASPGR